MSERWTPGPWRVRDEDGPPFTDVMAGERLLVTAYPEHYRHRDPERQAAEVILRSYAEAEANAKLTALAPRMAEALAACDRYFAACARAWAVDEGRVLNAEGHTIVAAEGLDRLSDIAGELVGRVWAEIAPLTGPASDRTTSNTDESKTDS